MKIIITATSDRIDSLFNPRFGRTEYFILFDSETTGWEALPNPAADSRGGAGPRAVQFIAESGANIVISGRYGPNAISALGAAGIKAYLAQEGTVDDVLQDYLENRLVLAKSASGPGMHGGDH